MSKFCANCGKELKGAKFCPDCGTEAVEKTTTAKKVATPVQEELPTSGLGIAGFVVGIVAMIIDPFAVLGITATALSSFGLAECVNGKKKGKGLAIAGLVMGIVAIVWALFKLAVYYA